MNYKWRIDMANSQSIQLKQVDQIQQNRWQLLIAQARGKINEADWEGACVLYKQAFTIAESMMCKQNCSKNCAVNRYLKTAEEFAFVMKKSNFDCALALFVGQIEDNIAQQEVNFSSAELSHRLNELAFSPKLAASY